MPRASTLQLARKARVQNLDEGILRLEGRLSAATQIPVFRVCHCGHDSCGRPLPDALPDDALVIELGCGFEVPQISIPVDQEQRSRSEVKTAPLPAAGSGLGTDGVRRTVETLRVLLR